MWWIRYRGEGKTGVDNIGVFEDDGTSRKEHPLLLDPSPDAHPLRTAALRSRLRARGTTISTLLTHGARTATLYATNDTVTPFASPRS